MELEQKICTIIANAGESRSNSMEAIECAKAAQFEEAEEMLEKAAKSLQIAHHCHTDILTESAKEGAEFSVTYILAHMLNHLLAAEVMLDVAKNFVYVIKEMKNHA